MSDWKRVGIKYLSRESMRSNNMGQAPLVPKYQRIFANEATGEISAVTDLESKRHKRNNCVSLFFKVYKKPFAKKMISILAVVVSQAEYSTITKFVNTMTRKLKRKGIERLGYVWVRDVGDERFHKHFHIIIATTRFDNEIFHELFCSKQHRNYEVQYVKTPKGIKKYLTEKDLFAAKKQRTFGKSRLFPLKKKNSSKSK